MEGASTLSSSFKLQTLLQRALYFPSHLYIFYFFENVIIDLKLPRCRIDFSYPRFLIGPRSDHRWSGMRSRHDSEKLRMHELRAPVVLDSLITQTLFK
jgi:hypothetical protein